MKKILGACCMLISFLQVKAQVAVTMNKVNVVYELVENPLIVAVEGCPCKEIRLTTDFGTINEDDTPCHYKYSSPRPGKATFTISRKEGTGYRKVGSMIYRVKRLPLPEATVGGIANGNMPADRFKVLLGLIAEISGGWDLRAEVLSFQVEVIRNGQLLLSVQNAGPKFNDKLKAFMSGAQAGDLVSFRSIRCRKNQEGDIWNLEPITISLK